MQSQTTGLINRESTERDVNNWMEDLLIRIQLRTMHEHDVIHHDGTAHEEKTSIVDLREMILDTLE